MSAFSLRIDPADSAPIWRQIEHGVARLVAAGALPPGAAIPSVRDLARELRVNPATVSKAYQRLVDGGLLQVRRGEGTFVADQPRSASRAERRGELREAATRYAVVATNLMTPADQAIEEVRGALASFQSKKGERE